MNVGDTVMVRANCYRYGKRCNGMVGIVRCINDNWDEPIAVSFANINNGNSNSGCFYFAEEHLLTNYPGKESNEDSSMFKHVSLSIKNVYFNDPVTVVMWNDGTKTIVRCSENDFYDSEKGLAMAIIKKVYGNDNSFHKIFKKWLPKEDSAEPVGVEELFANLRRILLGEE